MHPYSLHHPVRGDTARVLAECRTRTGNGCMPSSTPEKLAGMEEYSSLYGTEDHTRVCLVDAGICYKNSSNDGATWSKIWLVKVDATQPTVVCAGKSLILQCIVS